MKDKKVFAPSKIMVEDLDGGQFKIEGIEKAVGNSIYMVAASIELSDLARAIHSGKEVEIGKQEADFIKNAVARNNNLLVWAKNSIVKHLDELFTQESGEQNTTKG